MTFSTLTVGRVTLLYTRLCCVKVKAAILNVLENLLGSLQERIFDVLSTINRIVGYFRV